MKLFSDDADASWGMTLFQDVSPDEFGNFEHSFIVLMRVILGQCSLDPNLINPQDDSSTKLVACLFVTTFSMLRWLLPVLNLRMIFHDLSTTSPQQHPRIHTSGTAWATAKASPPAQNEQPTNFMTQQQQQQQQKLKLQPS